ncbi:MAG: hypothetical protein QE263_01365 [Vampirovibrionales bacterium]|nr:hypothetical protein [Vampirovibrionales bacterium]
MVSTATETPVAAPEAPAAPPLTTDVFTNCTSRCTRRIWDVFLSVRDDLTLFQTKLVRVRLTAATEQAAAEIGDILTTQYGVTEMTQLGDALELTASLATLQHVIKRPDVKTLDGMAID